MTLKECYEAIGGDYENAASRLINESMISRFVLKFLDDGSYELLIKSLQTKDYTEAFRAAHTLKGVCQNLSFNTLYESSEKLTEALRGGHEPKEPKLLEQVSRDYVKTVSAIREYRDANAA